MSYIDIVFDGPPSHESGRFVEVEDATGRSINAGEWLQRPDGYWVLRLEQVAEAPVSRTERASAKDTPISSRPEPLPSAGGEVEARAAANRWLLGGQSHPDAWCMARYIARSLPSASGGWRNDSSGAGAPPFDPKRSTRSALSVELQDVLGEIEEFLQDQHDIRDGAGGQQLPNKAMALSTALKEALGERP